MDTGGAGRPSASPACARSASRGRVRGRPGAVPSRRRVVVVMPRTAAAARGRGPGGRAGDSLMTGTQRGSRERPWGRSPNVLLGLGPEAGECRLRGIRRRQWSEAGATTGTRETEHDPDAAVADPGSGAAVEALIQGTDPTLPEGAWKGVRPRGPHCRHGAPQPAPPPPPPTPKGGSGGDGGSANVAVGGSWRLSHEEARRIMGLIHRHQNRGGAVAVGGTARPCP
jgi:hypothetical protein